MRSEEACIDREKKNQRLNSVVSNTKRWGNEDKPAKRDGKGIEGKSDKYIDDWKPNETISPRNRDVFYVISI